MTEIRAPLVPSLLKARAESEGEQVALIAHGRGAVTFGGWHRRSNAVAHALIDRDVRPLDRVGLIFPEDDWDDYAAAYMGVLKAGATAVPVSSGAGARQARTIFEKLGVKGAITTTEADELERHFGMFRADDLTAHPVDTDVQVDVDPGVAADIVYTSGSTGMPKAVCVSHQNLTYGLSVDVFERTDFSGPPGCSLHCTPIGTTAAQKNLVGALVRRDRIFVLLAHFEPSLFADAVAEYSPGSVALVPATALALHRAPHVVPPDGFLSVESVTLSSAPLTQRTVQAVQEAFPNAEIFDLYGSTEVGRGRLYRRCDATVATPFVPLAPTRIRVVDGEGKDVRAGVVGEVLVGHPAPPRWYDEDAASTMQVFQPDGWVRTGDLGHLTAEGSLHLAGRSDDVIITGGINVSPAEVEEALARHPGILEVAATGVPHPVLGQAVAAAYLIEPDATIDPLELRSFALAALGRHKAPLQMLRVDALPRNRALKVDRRALSDLIDSTSADADVLSAPDDAPPSIATDVLALAREVLDLPTLALGDDLFQAGLDSLTALELSVRLSSALGIDVDPWVCFDHPTPALLAEQLDDVRRSRLP